LIGNHIVVEANDRQSSPRGCGGARHDCGLRQNLDLRQRAGFEAQERELRAAGCEKVFAEQVSSVAARPQLEATLDYLRDVDVLVVTRIDRLARSVADLCAIIKRIEAKGATLRILAMNLDTSTSL
jgi:DNA invertase Pin-like site-specific DNA recombinase